MPLAPRYVDDSVILHHGDALAVMRTLPDASVDAVVTDPPYGLAEHKPAAIVAAMTAWCSGDRDHVPDGRGFMGRAWDGFVPPPAVWDECLRVLKPGGHLLCFAGTRTVDLMGISIRLAGFEMRDAIGNAAMAWVYGSGFPKSLNIGAAITKAAGLVPSEDEWPPEAEQWRGYGTALKPAWEPIFVARKPLAGTVAATVLAHGTAALNVDACRVGTSGGSTIPSGMDRLNAANAVHGYRPGAYAQGTPAPAGRWPANVVLTHGADCAEQCKDGCPVAELDAQSGDRPVAKTPSKAVGTESIYRPGQGGYQKQGPLHQDSGGASRYFPTFRYQAKAPTKERPKVDGVAHPTVKPLALMAWLVRLVTPPGGTVLDPFAGSGTTLQAARDEGFAAIGIERDEAYLPLVQQRFAESN